MFVAVVVFIAPGGRSVMAQAPPPPIPSLVSGYLQAIISYAGFAAGAVRCRLRPKEWGDTFHDKVTDLVRTHAGSPFPNFTANGEMTSSAHVPSEAEKNAALAAVSRKEQEGIYHASQPLAQTGEPSSYCTIVKNMALGELDDYVTGTASLWPAIGQ